MFLKNKKKAQTTMVFNWIYVLIAGGIILLFFIGIVVKQKSVSEQKLSYEVVRTLESILTGATVSEQTKNFIDTGALANYELSFTCELDEGNGYKEIFSGYGIEGTSATVETPAEVIFSPGLTSGAQLVTWSLPYDLPFKIMDFLLISSSDTKYYVFGSGHVDFKIELENSTEGLNFEFIESTSEIEIGNFNHVRLIYLESSSSINLISDGLILPPEIAELDDHKVSAVMFTRTGGVNYFHKVGDKIRKGNNAEIRIVTSGPDERDAAKYGVIFSKNEEHYKCNMMKAFKRVEILSKIYQKKFEQLVSYYDPSEGSDIEKPEKRLKCTSVLGGDDFLENLYGTARTCTIQGYDECMGLVEYAVKVKDLNQRLHSEGCIRIY